MIPETGARNASFPPGRLQELWPWLDEPADCRCVATRFSWNTGSTGPLEASDIDVPPRIARAVPRRLAEFVAGRRCAGEALRLLTGKALFPGQAEDRAPVWPEDIVGSISHSRDRAIAVAGRSERYRALGVDLETMLTETEAHEIAPQALTEREHARFGGRVDAFTVGLAFSAKESLFKALYPIVRRFCGFDASELAGWDPEGTALLRLTRDLSPEWCRGEEFAVHFRCLDGFLITRVSIERGKPRPPAERRSADGAAEGPYRA